MPVRFAPGKSLGRYAQVQCSCGFPAFFVRPVSDSTTSSGVMALSKEHKVLQQVLQQPGNNRCVDCSLQGTHS